MERERGIVRNPRSRPPPSPATVRAWNTLTREIGACRRCPLGSQRTQAVVYRGSLTPRLVFLGEAPGAEEDRQGLPFVGPSGRRLDAAVAALGIPPAEWGVLNVLKCRPPRNQFDRNAARTCRPFLDRQLAILRPEVIVPLGAHALRTIAPDAPAILRAAGRPRPGKGVAIFPLIHPAAAMRSRRWGRRWRRDVTRLGAWYRFCRAAPPARPIRFPAPGRRPRPLPSRSRGGRTRSRRFEGAGSG